MPSARGASADADPRSGADQAQLGEVAIGPHRERLALKTGVSLQGPANERGGAIETNQRVAGQIVEGRGQALGASGRRRWHVTQARSCRDGGR